MREILFRGKRIDNGEWVEGLYLVTKDIVSEEILHTIVRNPADSCGCEIWDFEVVDPKSISQFTGLTDKNGEKIFEGDIISDGGFTGVVVFDDKDDGAFLVIDPADPAGEADGEFFSGLIDREVCGNIYDNSELLEVER